MRSSLWYSLKYLSRRRKFTAVIFATILLVSIFISFQFSFYYYIEYRNNKNIELYKNMIKFWLVHPVNREDFSCIKNADGVSDYYDFLLLYYMIENPKENEKISYPIEIVDFSLIVYLLKALGCIDSVEGDVCLGFTLALKLNVKPGDDIKISNMSFTVKTILPQTFTDLDVMIFVSRLAFKEFISEDLKNKSNGAYVFLKSPEYEDKVSDYIEERFEMRGMITPSSVVKSMERLNRAQLLSNAFFSAIALIIGILVIAMSVYRDFESRRREIAILTAIGIKRAEIIRMFSQPLIAMSIIATLAGCLIASYIIVPLYHVVIYGYIQFFLVLTNSKALVTTLASVLLCILLLIVGLNRKIKDLKIMDLLRAEI